jgi:hypothetical protein
MSSCEITLPAGGKVTSIPDSFFSFERDFSDGVHYLCRLRDARLVDARII